MMTERGQLQRSVERLKAALEAAKQAAKEGEEKKEGARRTPKVRR